MITETNAVSEINETAAIDRNINVTNEIKRNHLQLQETEQVSSNLTTTDFSEKFARLKKSLRKRSSNIF